MPITKGAIRKLRADKGRHETNLVVKNAYKEAVSAMRKSPTVKNLVAVFSHLDRAVKVHLIHSNKSARLKSRLAKLVKSKTTKKTS